MVSLTALEVAIDLWHNDLKGHTQIPNNPQTPTKLNEAMLSEEEGTGQ
jgi:hypothetical protein